MKRMKQRANPRVMKIPEIPEDFYTILKFVDVDAAGRIYRGEKLWRNLENGPLNGFETALKDFEKNYRRLHLFADDWEVMADFALANEWAHKSLSELLAEAKIRGVDVIVHRENEAATEPKANPTAVSEVL